jgi:hypothetical protein
MLLFTKSLAVELAQQNVTVNSLSPGIINTTMNEICLGTNLQSPLYAYVYYLHPLSPSLHPLSTPSHSLSPLTEALDDPKCQDCSRHVEVYTH